MYKNTPLEFYFRDTNTPPSEIGKTLSFVRSSSGEFSQIRPYESGESSLRIDSKRSRFDVNEIVVREYIVEKEYFVAIVLLIDPILRYATDKYSKFDIISSALKDIFFSIHIHEYTGKIYVISQHGLKIFSIPRSKGETDDFFRYFSNAIYSSSVIASNKILSESLLSAYSSIQEGGLMLFGDKIPESQLIIFSQKYHEQTAAFEVIHEDEIGDNWDVNLHIKRKEYGAYGLCSSPNNIWLLLQNAFRIW